MPIVIAVTQLTSTSQAVLNEEIGIAGRWRKPSSVMPSLRRKPGLHGVVASPLEVAAIKAACGTGFMTVTPGIRPAGADIGDQSRIMTPREAVSKARIIWLSAVRLRLLPDPRASAGYILEEMIES